MKKDNDTLISRLSNEFDKKGIDFKINPDVAEHH